MWQFNQCDLNNLQHDIIRLILINIMRKEIQILYLKTSLYILKTLLHPLYLIKKGLFGKQINPGLVGFYDDYCIRKTELAIKLKKQQHVDGHNFVI